MKKHKKILACALCAVALLSAGVGLSSQKPVSATEATFVSSPVFMENYVIGETIGLESVKIAYGGKEYEAHAFLRLPDGTVIDKDEYTFTKGGAYSVEYRAKADNGEIISKTISFTVCKSVFSAGEKTVISKGEYTNRNGKYYEGLQVDLALGETFTYNKVIDLNDVSPTDNMFDLFVIPTKEGTADITSLTFTFTDVYDESNKVNVVHRQNGDTVVNSYLQAQAPGQSLVGLHRKDTLCASCVVVNGKYYHVNRGGQYGAWLNFSYSGQGKHQDGTERAPGEQVISLAWDYAEKAVYGRTQHMLSGGGLIADLDEPYMVTGWDGFTTGEVRLSVTASGYTGTSTRLFFTDFMNEDFNVTSFEDVDAPVLTVDKGAFDNNSLPKAKVGGRYKVFDASAFDLQDGTRSVKVQAYYGYYTNMRMEMPIADGYIQTPYAGVYTLVYSASDQSGRQSVEYVDVVAVDEEKIKPVLTVGSVSGEYVSGKKVAVAECSVKNATVDGVLTITATNKKNGKTYEVQDGKFLPLDAGEYEITYRYINYVFEVEEKSEITVAAGVQPVFLRDAQLPKYMINGMSYTLPKLIGYKIASGTAQEAEAEILVATDKGGAEKLNGYVYKVNAEKEVKVVYRLGETEIDYDIPVVNVVETQVVNGAQRKNLVAGAYFYAKEGTFSRTVNTGSNIAYKTTDTKGTLDYINSLLATHLKVAFRAFGDGLTGLNVVLSETYGNDEIVLSFTNKSCSINGGTPFEIPCTFSETGERFLIDYYNAERKLVFGESVEKTLFTTSDGRVFDGFEADKVDLSIELFGDGKEATFAIEQINNQSFPTTTDNVAPQLAHEDVSGSYSYGQKIVLPASFVGDVFSSDVTFKMYVKDPNGEYIISEEGITLDGSADPTKSYAFTLNGYGGYEVRFEWTDNFAWNARGKGGSYTYFLYAVDEEKPQIELGNKKTKGKVGESIRVASATLSDNITPTGEIQIHVCVKDPYGVLSYVENGTFTPKKAGVYTVLYTAYDKDGNMTMESYFVNVQ